jgi:hypothetical protein
MRIYGLLGAVVALGLSTAANAASGPNAFEFNDVVAGGASAVPEPLTCAMMLLGLAGLGYAGFQRGKAR